MEFILIHLDCILPLRHDSVLSIEGTSYDYLIVATVYDYIYVCGDERHVTEVVAIDFDHVVFGPIINKDSSNRGQIGQLSCVFFNYFRKGIIFRAQHVLAA